MSKKTDEIEVEGVVEEVCRAGTFKVSLFEEYGGREIDAFLSGKLRTNKIKIVVGDTVRLTMSPYDLTKGRIVYRER